MRINKLSIILLGGLLAMPLVSYSDTSESGGPAAGLLANAPKNGYSAITCAAIILATRTRAVASRRVCPPVCAKSWNAVVNCHRVGRKKLRVAKSLIANFI